MSPTDPTRLRQRLGLFTPQSPDDDGSLANYFDRMGRMAADEGLDVHDPRMATIDAVLAALPSLLATAEWARKARGVLTNLRDARDARRAAEDAVRAWMDEQAKETRLVNAGSAPTWWECEAAQKAEAEATRALGDALDSLLAPTGDAGGGDDGQ